MTTNLTRKQSQVLNVIEDYFAQNKMAPTLEELRTLLNVSSNQTVLNYLKVLEEKGYIQRQKKTRGIQLVVAAIEPEEENTLVDLLAKIAEQKKAIKQGKKKNTVTYSNPYSTDERSGKIISGVFNDGKY